MDLETAFKKHRDCLCIGNCSIFRQYFGVFIRVVNWF